MQCILGEKRKEWIYTMKKLKVMIFAVCALASAAPAAYAGSGYTDDNISFYEGLADSKNYSIDEIPKVSIRYRLSDGNDKYLLRLSGDENNVDLIKIYSGSGMQSYTYEFPTLSEGTHQFKLELLKNGETVYSESYSKAYVKSVGKGYGNRGFCTHFGHNTYFGEDADLLGAAGAELFRDGVYWETVEQTKGHYDFSAYNLYFKDINKKNIDQLFVATGENKLYLNENADLTVANEIEDASKREKAILNAKKKIVTDEQIDGFSNYVLEAAKKFPNITKFEIMNEPGFKYTGSEYSKIILAAAKKLKAYNQDIKVYAGCVVNESNPVEPGVDFTESFFTDELYPYIDYVSYHVYTPGNYAENPKFDGQVENYTNIISKNGGWKQLALTETGWFVINTGWGPDQTKQASELVKRAVIVDDLGYSDLTFYDFKNDGTDGSDGEDNWGVITNDRQMKKSYYSMKNYFKNVGKAQYIGRAYVADGIKAYAYKSNDGCFLITWAEPTVSDAYIQRTNNAKPEYAFVQEVVIKDMYGNETGTGKTLKSDFDPKYVYELSDSDVLAMIKAYGTDSLINLGEAYSAEENEIKAKYSELLQSGTKQALDEYTELCYSTGEKLIAEYKNGGLQVTAPEISDMLYRICNAAYAGGRTAALCGDIPNDADKEDLKAQYAAMSGMIDFSDLSELTYLSEPYKKGKELLNVTERYSEEGYGAPVSGKNYTLSADGMLKIAGTSGKRLVSVVLQNGGVDVYIDTLKVSDGAYETSVRLPGYGEYTLKISGENAENVLYTNSGYVSCEDAMTYCNVRNAEYLLKWTKILAADFLESKESGLPAYIKKRSENNRDYLYVKKKDKSGKCFVAAYMGSTLMSAAAENSDGMCILDVTDLDGYIVKVFDWTDIMTPAAQNSIYQNVKK